VTYAGGADEGGVIVELPAVTAVGGLSAEQG